LLLVHAGKPGAGGDVLDRAVAVADREPAALRQLDHLGHMTVLGGKLASSRTRASKVYPASRGAYSLPASPPGARKSASSVLVGQELDRCP